MSGEHCVNMYCPHLYVSYMTTCTGEHCVSQHGSLVCVDIHVRMSGQHIHVAMWFTCTVRMSGLHLYVTTWSTYMLRCGSHVLSALMVNIYMSTLVCHNMVNIHMSQHGQHTYVTTWSTYTCPPYVTTHIHSHMMSESKIL